MAVSENAIIRSWHARLGIGHKEDFTVGPVEHAALPLADLEPGAFLAALLDRALIHLDAQVVGFVSREERSAIGSDGGTPVFPAGLSWCSERAGRLADSDSPLLGPARDSYVVAQCDRGWFVAAGPKINPAQLTAYARIAGALWASARERAATAYAAATDPLTGLFNRLGLAQKMEQLPPRQEYVVAYFDLDDLKAANERGGHAEGDRLITKCAGVLQSTVREGDIVVREGGDEFVIVALGEDPVSIEGRVRAALDRAGVRCSLGLASVPGDASTYAEAREIADARQSEDKRERKGGRR